MIELLKRIAVQLEHRYALTLEPLGILVTLEISVTQAQQVTDQKSNIFFCIANLRKRSIEQN